MSDMDGTRRDTHYDEILQAHGVNIQQVESKVAKAETEIHELRGDVNNIGRELGEVKMSVAGISAATVSGNEENRRRFNDLSIALKDMSSAPTKISAQLLIAVGTASFGVLTSGIVAFWFVVTMLVGPVKEELKAHVSEDGHMPTLVAIRDLESRMDTSRDIILGIKARQDTHEDKLGRDAVLVATAQSELNNAVKDLEELTKSSSEHLYESAELRSRVEMLREDIQDMRETNILKSRGN